MCQSTTMCEPLQKKNSEQTESTKLTSSQVAFPAKMCHAPALEKALKTAMGKLLAADCGENTQGSLASLDQNMCWQKMYGVYCQPLLISDQAVTSELFSGTWPTWGMMRSGRVTELKPLARRTKGSEPLSWRTPDANLGARGPKSAEMYEECKKTNKHALNLLDQVKHECNWPTPITQDAKHGSISPAQEGKGLLTNKVIEQERNWPTPRANKVGGTTSEGYGLCLDEAVNGGRKAQNWPTPRAREGNSGEYGCKSCERNAGKFYLDGVVKQEEKIKGQLNADWVEILMNLPIGWTDIDCEEPQPWPGWPAPMNAGGNWGTPAARDGSGPSGLQNQKDLPKDVKMANNSTGQYPYEPPRVVVGQANRAKRLKCLGNGCVPAQIYPIFKAIIEMERVNK